MAIHKKSLDFEDDDIRVIEKIQSKMEKTQGKVSMIAAIRMAIRLAAKS